MNKIGNEKIFQNQEETGEKILHIFKEHKGPPCLISGPQEGKTGVAIYVAHHFIKQCKKEKQPFQVIWACNISDNNLIEQSLKRFKNANLIGTDDFIEEKNFVHRANYDKVDFKKDAKILIFVDECHEAINDFNKNGAGAKFYNFLKNIGVEYGKPISEWTNKNVFVLSVSATQFAQIANEASNIFNNTNFEFLTLENSDGYYSLEKLFNDNRAFQTKDFMDEISKNNWAPSEFILNILHSFIAKTENKSGNMVIRYRNTKNRKNKLIQYLEDNIHDFEPFRRLQIFSFSCKEKNIFKLDDEVSNNNGEENKIIFIADSLKAGKTLTNTEYLHYWIDNNAEYPSTTIQSAGRLCGRNKEKDTCIYYGNLNHIKEAIEFYKDPSKKSLESPYNKPFDENKIIKVPVIKKWSQTSLYDPNLTFKEFLENPKNVKNFISNISEFELKTILRANNTYFDAIKSYEASWSKGGILRGKQFVHIDSIPKVLLNSGSHIEITKRRQIWEEQFNEIVNNPQYKCNDNDGLIVIFEKQLEGKSRSHQGLMKIKVMPSMKSNSIDFNFEQKSIQKEDKSWKNLKLLKRFFKKK